MTRTLPSPPLATSPRARRFVQRIGDVLERFPTIDRSDAVIAFSGGKDSVALAVAMRALGKRVRLRAIDMGYSAAWGGRIEALAQSLSLPVEIVAVAELSQGDRIHPSVKTNLRQRRLSLDTLVSASGVSPCTNCYNCKIISLVHGTKADSAVLYFGHHATDMISSFWKSALMYYDRWRNNNAAFDRARFRQISLEAGADFKSGKSLFLQLFIEFLYEGKAGTSEPPYERATLFERPYTICRPMITVSETETREFVGDLGVAVESSGCGHSLSATTRTPREIVQYEALPLATSTASGVENLRRLEREIIENFAENETHWLDTRRNREALLGAEYRGGAADRL